MIIAQVFNIKVEYLSIKFNGLGLSFFIMNLKDNAIGMFHLNYSKLNILQ